MLLDHTIRRVVVKTSSTKREKKKLGEPSPPKPQLQEKQRNRPHEPAAFARLKTASYLYNGEALVVYIYKEEKDR